MNPEAISAIKAASLLCKQQKAVILSTPHAELNQLIDNPQEDSPSIETNFNAENTDHPFQLTLESKQNSYSAKCTFTLYFGNDKLISELVNTNRESVKDTCESLCPGLNNDDIIEVLELSKGQFELCKQQTSITNLNSHSRLMAGDIISVEATYSALNPKTDSKEHSCHSEMILITGNGAQILT